MTNDSCWQVRTFDGCHSHCVRDFKNKCVNSMWLGKTFAKKFSTNPKLGHLEFREDISTILQSDFSSKTAYMVKRKALKLVQGSVDEQFRQIKKYCAELKRSDAGATVVLKLTEDDKGPRFQRLYVKHGGQLLSAVGLDPNNNIFPICYAMVERETKDSWTWFLQLLNEDIGVGNDPHTWTFMSDKQKCLIPTLESLASDAEHRFCVRHLESNMKRDGFKSVAVKIAFWAAEKTTRIEEFQVHMAELKDIDAKAYEWLAKKPETSDLRWNGRICSKIKDVLAKIYVEAIRYSPMNSDEMHYQIMRSYDRRDQHSVDLLNRSCS
ncbi:uncharacterized protein LOC142537436 [Primulina tabacum]|uniref:uncharacterized protein LOC142537436 n=1 Tax=Primulina tabacum TaxID=48773 RepID=UPI003F59A749